MEATRSRAKGFPNCIRPAYLVREEGRDEEVGWDGLIQASKQDQR